MDTKEKPNALRKLAELTDDALRQATGGRGEFGTLERILNEISAWLDAHPNATKSDIHSILKEKKEAYADALTADELRALDEYIDSLTA